jgi:hypothetical protein
VQAQVYDCIEWVNKKFEQIQINRLADLVTKLFYSLNKGQKGQKGQKRAKRAKRAKRGKIS